MLFTHFIFLIIILNVTIYQDKEQFKDFEKKCQNVNYCFINNKIFNLIYD